MKYNKRTILSIGASLLFGAAFPIFLKWRQNASIFDISTLLFTITNMISILFVIHFFNKMLSNSLNRFSIKKKKSLIVSFIFFIIKSSFVCFFFFILGTYLLYIIKGWDTAQFLIKFFQREITGATLSVTAGLFIAAIFFFNIIWNQAINKERQLREDNLKYKYINLKAQVNPHFLFNSLNTLSELIYVDAGKADMYIQKLAGIYRYILDHEETDLIPLDEELTFIRQYFELQQERDGDKIILDMNIRNADKYKIIPVSLQILVENALKHNSASKENPLKIDIKNDNDNIIVTNTIQLKNIVNHSSGTGLSNLRERVKLTVGKEVSIIRENNLFIVKLPIIKIK